MKLKLITINDEEWKNIIEYAQNYTWEAGQSLAKKMINNYFYDWQRVMIALLLFALL